MPSGRKQAVKARPELTASQVAELKSYEGNWELALECLCRIGDRKAKGKVIPFKLRKEQKKLFTVIQKQRALNIYKSLRRNYPEDYRRLLTQLLPNSNPESAKSCVNAIAAARPEAIVLKLHEWEYNEVTDSPVLIIVVKARQVGVSTLIEMVLFLLAFFNPGSQVLVLSVDDDSSANVMGMTGRMVEHWPEDKLHFAPTLEANARDRLKLHNGATFLSRTIKGGTIRSFRYDGNHLTEFAHYPDQEAISDALIAKPDHSWVFIESTASGKTGEYPRRYREAVTIDELLDAYDSQQPMADQQYVKWFSSWLDDPDYRTPVEDWEREALQNSLDEYEKSLFKRFPDQMSPERVKWRREKIRNECQGKKNLSPEQFFMQEFPADEEEAFQQGSKTIFNHAAIQRQKMRAKEKKPIAYFNWEDEKKKPKLVGFEHQANMVIWELPKKDSLYIVAADIGGGLMQDYTILPIYDRLDGTRERMVGIFWTNRMNEIATAHIAVAICRMYNDAFLIPEANNYGHSFMNTVHQTLRYFSMYTRETLDSKGALMQQDKWGFDTKRTTKQELIAKMQEALNDDLIEIYDLKTLEELEIYELSDPNKSTTKMGAPSGEHDDRVIASALARFGARPLHGAPSMSRHTAKMQAADRPSGTHPLPAQTTESDLSKNDLDLIQLVARQEAAHDLKLKKQRTVDKKNPFSRYN